MCNDWVSSWQCKFLKRLFRQSREATGGVEFLQIWILQFLDKILSLIVYLQSGFWNNTSNAGKSNNQNMCSGQPKGLNIRWFHINVNILFVTKKIFKMSAEECVRFSNFVYIINHFERSHSNKTLHDMKSVVAIYKQYSFYYLWASK